MLESKWTTNTTKVTEKLIGKMIRTAKAVISAREGSFGNTKQ